jgi:hypothetical protein
MLQVGLAAWLLASGGLVTRQAVRLALAVLAILSALLAAWLLINASS